MNEMGMRIEQKRKEKGMTMEELATFLGVGASAINKYEKGLVQNIKRTNIQKMAELFDCSPTWLMGWTDEISTTDYDRLKAIAEKYYRNYDGINYIKIDKYIEQVFTELKNTYPIDNCYIEDADFYLICNKTLTRAIRSSTHSNVDIETIIKGQPVNIENIQSSNSSTEHRKALEMYKKYIDAPDSIKAAINNLLGIEE